MNIQSITLLLLLLATTIQAQQDFEVSEQTTAMSKGSYNSLSIQIDGADKKTVIKCWKKYLSKYFKGKTKYDRKTNESFTDDMRVEDLSDNTIDVYAVVQERPEGAHLTAWFNLGVTYLSSEEHPERFPSAEKMLIDFGYYVLADVIDKRLKDKKKELRKEEKVLKKIERTKKKYEKKIEKLEKTIAKAEKDIDSNEEEITQQEEEATKQTSEIEATNEEIEEIKRLLQEVKNRL